MSPIASSEEKGSSRGLALALGAPPAAWFATLVAAYVVTGAACTTPLGPLARHGVFLVTLPIALAGTWTAARGWKADGWAWPGEAAHPLDRTRFLVVAGTLSGTLFTVVILLQWVAMLVLGPCEPDPRGPFAPDL